jgi:hypothetical protein
MTTATKQPTLLRKANRKLNAMQHGACSRTDGLLPFEDPREYEALRDEYFTHFLPNSLTERECVDAVVRNRWARKRATRILQVFHDAHPFSRAVSAHDQDLGAAAREELSKQRNALQEVQKAAQQVEKAAALAENQKLQKQLLKNATDLAARVAGIEQKLEAYLSYVLGFHDRVRRQAAVEQELDAAFQKRIKDVYAAEQYEETRQKILKAKRAQANVVTEFDADDFEDRSTPSGRRASVFRDDDDGDFSAPDTSGKHSHRDASMTKPSAS